MTKYIYVMHSSKYRFSRSKTGIEAFSSWIPFHILTIFSTKKKGSGLGLAIARRIVEDHGGEIRVEDNTPKGARFVIDLPA